jgi:serine/threonine protein kinase
MLRLAGATGRGTWALVTELLTGKGLFEVVGDRGPLAEPQVQVIARQLLSVLDYILRRGIVHRDVKPENVIVTRKGVQLMDFGVASHQDDARSMAPRVGSAGDLAPELLLGAQEDRTTRMDCFGIGSLLYFVRFGQTPFSPRAGLQSEKMFLGFFLEKSCFSIFGLGLSTDTRILHRSSQSERPFTLLRWVAFGVWVFA